VARIAIMRGSNTISVALTIISSGNRRGDGRQALRRACGFRLPRAATLWRDGETARRRLTAAGCSGGGGGGGGGRGGGRKRRGKRGENRFSRHQRLSGAAAKQLPY